MPAKKKAEPKKAPAKKTVAKRKPAAKKAPVKKVVKPVLDSKTKDCLLYTSPSPRD